MGIRDFGDDGFTSGSDAPKAYELPGEPSFWRIVFEGLHVEKERFLRQIDELSAARMTELLVHLTTLRNVKGALESAGVPEESAKAVQENLRKLCNWIQQPLSKKQAKETASGLELAVDTRTRTHRSETAGAVSEALEDTESPVEAKPPRPSISPIASIAKTEFLPALNDPEETANWNRLIYAVVSELDNWRNKAVGLVINVLSKNPELRAKMQDYSEADKKGGFVGLLKKANHQLSDLVMSGHRTTDIFETAKSLFAEGKALLQSEQLQELNEKLEKLDEGRFIGGMQQIKRGGYDPNEAKQLSRKDTVEIVKTHFNGLGERFVQMKAELNTQVSIHPDAKSTFYQVLEAYRIASEQFLVVYEKIGDMLGEDTSTNQEESK